MSVARLSAGALCAGVFMLACAHAADFAQIGPQASAAQLIAARGKIVEPALEFVYKASGGAASGTMTIDIAPDFTTVYRDMEGTIYDYALRRIIQVDDTTRSFSNASLYGLVDFYRAETDNRRMQRQLLAKVGLKSTDKGKGAAAFFDPFWVQSELHVMDPQDGTPKIARRVGADGSVHFSFHGKDVASYTPSKQALSKEQAAGLAKFLRMETSLHPTIIDEIAATGVLPQRLSYALPPMLKKPAAAWTLQSSTPVKAAYLLRAGTKPMLLGKRSENPLADVLPLMQAAVAGQAPGRRSAADFHAAIDAAMDKKQLFQAVVLVLELNLQYGTQGADCAAPCHSLKEVVTAGQSDPRVQAMIGALQPANGQLDAAIKTLGGLKRDDLSDPYVVGDFLANDLSEAGNQDAALPLFAAAIKGNPYLGGYYKDLGDLFRRSFEPDLAWLCYDLGRALPGGASAPVISDMNGYEADLAAKYPQFF
jgi:hypothetical protein